MKLDILYEDTDYIIIHKPSGLLSIPDRHNAEIASALQIVRHTFDSVLVVHRLDRDTSGILCFAKNEASHKYLSSLFANRTIEKFYLGIVHGSMPEASGVIDAAIMEHPTVNGKMIIHQKQGKPSITKFEVIENFGLYSLVQFSILTGRTHQIRVHMQHYGHSIVGDGVYGKADPIYISQLKKRFKLSKNEEEERPILHRLALHASKLKFIREDGSPLTVECPLPKDMQATVQQCRKWLR
jgi:23S rRNA pseudouridine1911/1915/1917 synthase